jgi:hypothetical protein
MADWFSRSSEALDKVQDTGSLLGVFTLGLLGVENPFDADPLWDRRYGGRAEIAEQLTGERDFRLQAALDGCRNSVFERDSAGRFREANPVFTDVVMWIPEARWRADAIRGGGHLGALQHSLSVLHTDKFGRSLPKNRTPRYSVMADPRLAEDRVVFQFGFGVFVPDSHDVLEAEIGVSELGDARLKPMPPWVSWSNGAQTQRPVGVYRGQRSILISGCDEGPIRPGLWFSERIGHVMVNLNAEDAERIYPSTSRIRVVDTQMQTQPDSIQWRLDFKGELGSESLWLQIKPVSGSAFRVVSQQPADVNEPSKRVDISNVAAASTSNASGEPAQPGKTDEPGLSTRFSLRLVGLALFRIDGARMPGLAQWTIWLDDWGWPVREASMSDIDEASCLALRSRSGANRLEFRPAGGRDFESVAELPFAIEAKAGGELSLLPPPDPRRYLAMLMLNASITLPLSRTPLSLGRATPSEKAEPDLPIDLLDHPRSAKWDAGAPNAGARLDAIDLSRRHVSVRLLDDRLEVAMAGGSTPAFVLDRDGAPQTELLPRSQNTATLDPGQHLLLGGYVFRFQRDKAHTAPSSWGQRKLRDHR